jgi:hypothetical protein
VEQVFVIDSADRARLEEVNKELGRLITEEDKLAAVPLLVFANKQDLLAALSAADVSPQECSSPYEVCSCASFALYLVSERLVSLRICSIHALRRESLLWSGG